MKIAEQLQALADQAKVWEENDSLQDSTTELHTLNCGTLEYRCSTIALTELMDELVEQIKYSSIDYVLYKLKR